MFIDIKPIGAVWEVFFGQNLQKKFLTKKEALAFALSFRDTNIRGVRTYDDSGRKLTEFTFSSCELPAIEVNPKQSESTS
jgi:hypothetical protein